MDTQPIGTVDTIGGAPSVIRADGLRVELEAGAPLFQGDVIETDEGGAVSIVFVDNSTFAMDAGGRMVLDEFIFDPASQEGSSAFTVVQGVFSFVSGEIAKTGPEAMIVNTPVAMIGIRGTEVAVRTDGEATFIALLAEDDGAVGEIVVTNGAGTQVLNIANQTTTVSSGLIAPSVPEVLSRSQLSELFTADFEALTKQDFRDSSGDRSDRGAGEGGGESDFEIRVEELKEATLEASADSDVAALAETAAETALATLLDSEGLESEEVATEAALREGIAPAAGHSADGRSLVLNDTEEPSARPEPSAQLGNARIDLIEGDVGRDRLSSAGENVIVGGAGRDRLIGGDDGGEFHYGDLADGHAVVTDLDGGKGHFVFDEGVLGDIVSADGRVIFAVVDEEPGGADDLGQAGFVFELNDGGDPDSRGYTTIVQTEIDLTTTDTALG